MAENKNAQQVREITDKLEQGIKELFESERFKEYLRTMSKFYNYSFNNTLLIAMQKPEATYVAGYTSWQRNFDRQVMKGEKGIKILAPAPYKTQEEREKVDPVTQKPVIGADGKAVTETVEVLRPAFKVVSVFDVSQTDGKELPDIIVDELKGTVENYEAFFDALKQESPVPVSFEDIPGGAKGYFSPVENRIAIQEGMSEIQTIKTAIHEIAHAKLHSIDRPEPEPSWKIVMISDGGTKRDFLSGFASETDANEAAEREGWRFVDENRFEWRLEVEEDTSAVQEMRKDRHTKEVEAESVAYTVCQRYGIETSDYSFGYIAGWSSDKETKELKGSLETIRKTAAEMIDSIDAKLKQEVAQQKDFEMNADTSGLTVAGHIGTWHTIDQHEVGGHSFYLMEHDTYGDEAACIIVDERGKLVLDDVYNGFDDDTLRLLDLEVKEVLEMPDSAISVQDMKDYGYAWAGVLPAGQEAAEKALEKGCEVYRLYSDNTEGLCVDAKEIADHAAKGGMLGISKESWMAALEKENYLKAAEMSMEDDYGMIDGIINNGPKEDKTAEVKAPERGEKSSIMDRLKSAKAEKQKECCPPKKHKGEIEL